MSLIFPCLAQMHPDFLNHADPDQLASEASWSGSALSAF